MTKIERFLDAWEGLTRFSRDATWSTGMKGDGWVEVLMEPAALDTARGRGALRVLTEAARRHDVAVVMHGGTASSDALAQMGFEWWLGGVDGMAISRPRHDWNCVLDRVPGFTLGDVARMTEAVQGVATERAFDDLAEGLVGPGSWPDRGKAHDRLRVALFRSRDAGLDGLLEDLGHSRLPAPTDL